MERATIFPGFSGTLLEFHGALHRVPIPRTGPGNNNNNNIAADVIEFHYCFVFNTFDELIRTLLLGVYCDSNDYCHNIFALLTF